MEDSKDLISRQEAIEDAREAFKRNPTMAIRVMDLIKSMPSAQPSFPQRHENDLISRAEAIDALNNIASDLHARKRLDEEYIASWCAETIEQLPSAQPTQTNTPNTLKSLDCIDRQAAIDAVIKRDANCGIDNAEVLRSLPSAQPDPPEWVHTVERYLQNVPAWIVNPIAWALYQSWKEYHKKMR